MDWQYIDYDGQRYELGHLETFQFEIERPVTDKQKGWTIEVEVTFGWHCYTRSPQDNETDRIYRMGREQRCFCPVRFELSKSLPDIVRDFAERKIFQSGKGNFLTIEIIDHEGNKEDYEIYFNLRKQGKKKPLKLYIESAYIREQKAAAMRQRRKHRAIRFRVLVYNIKHEKPVRYGK